MQKYLLVGKLAVQDILEYRFDFFMHAFKYGLFIALMAIVWLAVNATSPLENLSASSIILYFSMGSIIYSLSNFHTVYIEEDIKLGNLNKYILRPISPTLYYFIFQAVISFFELFLKAAFIVPLLLIWGNIFSIKGINVFIFLLYLPLIFSFSFFAYSIISNLAFWFQEVFSLRLTVMFVFRMLSGVMIPVMLFPKEVQDFLFLTPITHLAHAPIQTIQSNYTLQQSISSLMILSFWTLVTIAIHTGIWKLGKKAYEGSGI